MENTVPMPAPKRQLSYFDAISIVVGIVIGAGVFRTPSLVALHTSDERMFILAWVLGGIISLIGALCYAELTTAFPHAGGDYYFIRKAFGPKPAFLFAWARMTIIQTGSIALLAFIFGDYMSHVYSLGAYSSVYYALIVVGLLTLINVLGIRLGTAVQKIFTLTEVAGILMIILAGFFIINGDSGAPSEVAPTSDSEHYLGLALVFVLLTFGGWSEAAYISAEIKSGKTGMVRTLLFSLIFISLIYLLINMAYLKVLGHPGVSESTAVAADVMESAWGSTGVWLIGMFVAVSALTSANATIFTGARSNYALGRDFRIFSRLGIWNNQRSGPVNALLVQGGIAILLVGFGFFTRSGFETIVEYTAPVFWFFFLLVGLALFVLRKKAPGTPRPFRVPLYPLTPVIFCLSSLYLLYSSIVYTGTGALFGIGIMLAGILVLYLFRPGLKN